MRIERAIEIQNSPGVIDVKYNGNNVWIEEVHKDTESVLVKDLTTNKEIEVPVSKLQEGK
ncbi:H-type small acid-soluble spore protein [Fonticella tunisiensis]|uniref:Small acid-soluble spore protein H (Minor) n=1 Tax=Fonticella tunisiensis TaxID=1096341 RepID=A0A4R7KSS1_9CLOT|nr:H-type small acid-soluble spore protein [Fonticella tunisiensis]TDT62857.1 small acid-soluble spore protein H (minor) [Fonticella tunisiensis]